MVNRKEGEPHTADHQHAEQSGTWLHGFTEGVRQVPGQESRVSQDTAEGRDWAFVAQDEEVAMLRVCPCFNESGELPSQTPRRMGWMREQMAMMESGAPDTIHLLILVPGAVVLKVRATVTVLAETVETAAIKTPKVTCGRVRVAVLGRQMETKEQRKQKAREMGRT
ncbi:hypothetical protein HJG60_012083 [Phyllostomus discolor]|uniref:Uncharacterized protein n=1 Tax=Phyllostomus discolor TaxID=89673 RepID=A0A834DWD6_9CHIR|nr:hypothetical protein HJG60_012083 [Phyllostomus discolor]